MSEKLKEQLHARKSQATEPEVEDEVSRPEKGKAKKVNSSPVEKKPTKSPKQALGFAGKCVYNPTGMDLKSHG